MGDRWRFPTLAAMKLRRNMGHRYCLGSGRCWVDEWSDRIVRVVQGAVGVEGFAGAFFEKDFVVAEELVDFVAFFDGDEGAVGLISVEENFVVARDRVSGF